MPKGDRNERELVNELDEQGFEVMRAPASGSATDRELPDVVASDGEVGYAIEAKSVGSGKKYIDFEEIVGVLKFAKCFGVRARIGTRYNRREWRFFHPAELYKTDSGNHRISKDKLDSGQTVEDL